MLPYIFINDGTYLLNIMYSDALAHAAVPYQASHYSIPLSIALAFGRSAVAKPSRGFPLQYRLLIVLAFERGTRVKLSRGFPLQYRQLIALAFERCAVVKLSRHNQAHHLSSNGWVAWTASSCHLSRVSSVLNIPEVPPRHPETHISEEYV